jgi:hypothetical protein
VRTTLGALVGMGLYGFALRAALGGELSAEHARFAAALPAAFVAAWAITSLYLLWAARHEGVSLRQCVQAIADATVTAGLCLASTAAIVWFFAATAPASSVPKALGFSFTGIGFLAAGVEFGKSLRAQGAPLNGRTELMFLGLTLVTFTHFAAGAGLRWF